MQAKTIIVGGGLTGLSAAYELALRDHPSVVLEAEANLGGLAGVFSVPGGKLEKFYHHGFNSDVDILALADELGIGDHIEPHASRTGIFHANTIYHMASPWDLLKFRPLSFIGRLRLGLLALRARRVHDWRKLEAITAREWLTALAGEEVFRIVWEPLLRGKFGDAADEISAVWFWNKLKLRGGSRGKGGAEELLYCRGGFGTLLQSLANWLTQHGVEIRTSSPARRIEVRQGRVIGVTTDVETLPSDRVLVTTAIPPFVGMCPDLPSDYTRDIGRIRYLANVCAVLLLDRSLSDIYWLNVNDPSYPFVGIIEHTNLDRADHYAGRYVVYLSKYLPADSDLYQMSDTAVIEYCLPYVQRMFPAFDPSWIRERYVWRAEHSQPVITRNYSQQIPGFATPIDGLWLCTMAQIYPEDRGMNYAVRYGRMVAGRMVMAPIG